MIEQSGMDENKCDMIFKAIEKMEATNLFQKKFTDFFK